MNSPSIGYVGTLNDIFMTSDSEGALISAGGLWNIRGALTLCKVDGSIALCSKIFPVGTGFTVKEET